MKNTRKNKFGGAKIEALGFFTMFIILLYSFWGIAAMLSAQKTF